MLNTAYLDAFTTKYPTQWKAYTARHPEAKQTKNVVAFTMNDAGAPPVKETSSSSSGDDDSFFSFRKQSDAGSQSSSTSSEEGSKIYDMVEQMPQFPGGQAYMFQYISRNTKYPPEAERNRITGKVLCTFVVERDGSITDVNVVKSVHPALDKEAIRVIKAMPRWIPGKQNGSAVRVKYTIPVTFNL